MIYYRINILEALKEKGYSTTRLREEKLIGEATIQNLRSEQEAKVSMKSLSKICELLGKQPGEIIGYISDTKSEYELK